MKNQHLPVNLIYLIYFGSSTDYFINVSEILDGLRIAWKRPQEDKG